MRFRSKTSRSAKRFNEGYGLERTATVATQCDVKTECTTFTDCCRSILGSSDSTQLTLCQEGHVCRTRRGFGVALRQEGHVCRTRRGFGVALRQEGHVCRSASGSDSPSVRRAIRVLFLAST